MFNILKDLYLGEVEESCDLHTHTCYSKDSPATLDDYVGIYLPKAIGRCRLLRISITDHQTLRAYTRGNAESLIHEFNKILPGHRRVELILGVELSLDMDYPKTRRHVHFLFYHPTSEAEGDLTRTALWLEKGLLGDVMQEIVEQNNKRHRLMARKAARHEGLTPSETAALLKLIDMEKRPSPEIGREHLKRVLITLCGQNDRGKESKIRTMFVRPKPGHDHEDCCYVSLYEAGRGAPYEKTLAALRREYPCATIALAHPWREGLNNICADSRIPEDNALLGMNIEINNFIDRLARQGLINGLEVYGNFQINDYLRHMSFQELRQKQIPEDLCDRIERGEDFCRYWGSEFMEIARKNRLITTGGNDSHGSCKPFPVGYGIPATNPFIFPKSYTTIRIRHTPRPIPALTCYCK